MITNIAPACQCTPAINTIFNELEQFFASIELNAHEARVRPLDAYTQFEFRFGRRGIWSSAQQAATLEKLTQYIGSDLKSLDFEDSEVEWDNDRIWPQTVRFQTFTQF